MMRDQWTTRGLVAASAMFSTTIVVATKDVLHRFAPTPGGGVGGHFTRFDRNAGGDGTCQAVAARAGKMPAPLDPADFDGVNLPITLHRLAERFRPDRVDLAQPLTDDDLARVQQQNFARDLRSIVVRDIRRLDSSGHISAHLR